jgi:hypothetical protein
MEPASIRYKNPGAMWGNSLALKWGAEKKAVILNDGKGQGNNIAVFPAYINGICAQMDLWRTSPNYRNKKFGDAIAIWCGHNDTEGYISWCEKRVPGMTRDTLMDDAFWHGPMAVPFLKAQAWHEAGKPYPAADDDWTKAQQIVLNGAAAPKPPVSVAAKGATGGAVVATTTVVAAGVHQGWAISEIALATFIAIGVVVALFALIKTINK